MQTYAGPPIGEMVACAMHEMLYGMLLCFRCRIEE